MNYYNEFDPFAASWLRELIKEGLIPSGEVDERSIIEVTGEDLKGFTQCHFFAGIGGWSYALQLAGWEPDRSVWTGSPPCQPFSVAGNKKGKEDERHLWPHFFGLIRECQPPAVFGEQVASAIKDGWFDDLQDDMEAEGYATAMAVLPACSIGAPHKRDRLFFMADSIHQGSQGWIQRREDQKREDQHRCIGCDSSVSSLADTSSERKHSLLHRMEQRRKQEDHPKAHWDSEIVECRDGKYRPIPTEPALFPLADGIPNRVGLLRGAGNAIVPQVAAEIIKIYMDYKNESTNPTWLPHLTTEQGACSRQRDCQVEEEKEL